METYKIAFGSYEISDLGNVRKKLKTNNYKEIKCSILTNGYKYFQTRSKDNKRKNHYIHQLVLKVFVSERPKGKIVDHIDRNKTNNCLKNLRYVSYQENAQNTDRYKSDIIEQGKERKLKLARLRRQIKKKQITKELEEKEKPAN